MTSASRAMFRALNATTATPTMAVTPAICFARMPNRIRRMSKGKGQRSSRTFDLRDDLFFRALARHPAAQFVQLVVERLQAYSEDLGGARLVVARVLERHQDQPPLRFLDRGPGSEGDERFHHVG